MLLFYRVLEGLGEAYRTTFILFELEGLSGERIAEITGTRLGTVWVRLTRARRIFIERMRQLEERERREQQPQRTKGTAMKHDPSDVDSILRWRDRPEGGASDEDRAAALVRDALAPGAFPVGLDDRQLAAIEESLKTERRARPPFWLRPALVAALRERERGVGDGIRDRLVRAAARAASLPIDSAAAPAPVEHPKKRAARIRRPRRRRSDSSTPADPLPRSTSRAAREPARSRPTVRARAGREGAPAATPIRKVAVADSPPPPPPAVERVEPTAASEEIQALERAVGLLRGKHDAPAALAALDDYIARFPGGVLAPEARVARVDALADARSRRTRRCGRSRRCRSTRTAARRSCS